MMLVLTTVVGLAPGLLMPYRQMFGRASDLEPFGALSTPRRAAHFLAQCLNETGGLRRLTENLNYSAPRLCEIWPSRFPTEAAALPFAHNARALANRVYGGRMGNTDPGDGYRFIGRGLLQLTGRAAYARIGENLSIDLVTDPGLATHPAYGLSVAGEIWRSAGCNALADVDTLEGVTQAINGGLVGLEARRLWLEKVRAALTAAAVVEA